MKASIIEDYFIIHDTREGVGNVKYIVLNEKSYKKIMYNETESHGGYKVKVNGTVSGVIVYLGIHYVFNSVNSSNIELIKVDSIRKKKGRYRFK